MIDRVRPNTSLNTSHLQGDEVHIMLAARSDPACFAPLYDLYFPRIYAYCLCRVNSPDEAEDLTSQIFIRALKHLSDYRGGTVAAWLFRIARSVVANYHRGHHLTVALDDDLLDDEETPMEILLLDEERRTVQALVDTLPKADRELLALRVDAGLTSEQIGMVLGKRAGAVRMMLHRVFKRLQAQLTEDIP